MSNNLDKKGVGVGGGDLFNYSVYSVLHSECKSNSPFGNYISTAIRENDSALRG